MVYGGVESVGHKSGGILDKKLRLCRRHEGRSPREKNGKIEKVAEERVPVVADLKRLDNAGALTLAAGTGRRALYASPGQDLQPEERHENDRHQRSENRAQPTTESAVLSRGMFH